MHEINVCTRDVPAVWEEDCFVVQGFLSVTGFKTQRVSVMPPALIGTFVLIFGKQNFSNTQRITEQAYVLFILFFSPVHDLFLDTSVNLVTNTRRGSKSA